MLIYGSLLCLLPFAASTASVWPQPVHIESGNDVLWVNDNFRAYMFCGHNSTQHNFTLSTGPASVFEQSQERVSRTWRTWQAYLGYANDARREPSVVSEADHLRSAVKDAMSGIRRTKFAPWKFYSRGSRFEPHGDNLIDGLAAVEIIQKSCPSNGFDPATFFDGDESYTITVEGNITKIYTKSTIGTIRSLETLKQLFYTHSITGRPYTPYAPITVKDHPHWQYRGLSLDIARNPFSIEDVIRTIDAMASVKLSKLHLHATDSQSWPLDIPALPKLASKGAYQPDLVWSADDLARVQSHGVSKGVQVFLELDMPGHTASVAHAYPELIAAYNMLDWSTFAAEPLSGQLKLNSSQVYDFLDKLFSDLLPRLTPYNTMYHLGGDELNRKVHLLDETVRSDKYEVLQPLIQKFMETVTKKAVHQGLRPMVWEEMILEWDLDLTTTDNKKTVKPLVQAWRSSENIKTLLEKGFPVIFGDSEHWYLDCGFGSFLDPYPSGKSPSGVPFNSSGGQPSQLKEPYLDYCSPYHNWRAMYMFDPLKGIPSHLHSGVEGGEALMWSEQTDGVDLDYKLWPRAAAAAEVLWAGPRKEAMISSATSRLAQWRERMVVDRKVAASPVQMTWCLMEGGCEY